MNQPIRLDKRSTRTALLAPSLADPRTIRRLTRDGIMTVEWDAVAGEDRPVLTPAGALYLRYLIAVMHG